MSPPSAADMEQSAVLCYSMCQRFFGGAWAGAKYRDGSVKRLSGSLSNELYVCCLPDEACSVDSSAPAAGAAAASSSSSSHSAVAVPRRVLVRLYGLSSTDPQAVLQDCILFALLSERGLGPKFYGCFHGGRLEEFIESRCLLTHELSDTVLSQQMARMMASLHQVKMPLCREPVILRERLTRWQQECRSGKMAAASIKNSAVLRTMANFNLDDEIRFLLKVLYASDSPVVFCHNDLQEGNILVKDDGSGLVFIDFEYAAYNFRGFDIANHFCERCYNYTATEAPYFVANLDDYPSEAEQVVFIRHYLEAQQTPVGAMEAEVRRMLREVSTFVLASHMSWALWSLMSAKKSRIQFGYLEYAVARLEGYAVFKRRLLERYPEVVSAGVACTTESFSVLAGNCATAADRVDIAFGLDMDCGAI